MTNNSSITECCGGTTARRRRLAKGLSLMLAGLIVGAGGVLLMPRFPPPFQNPTELDPPTPQKESASTPEVKKPAKIVIVENLKPQRDTDPILRVTEPNALDTKKTDYAPISPTARWIYSVDYQVVLGVQKGKAMVRVDGSETIRGKSYHKVVTVFTGIPGLHPAVWYARRLEDGKYEAIDSLSDRSWVSPVTLALRPERRRFDQFGHRTDLSETTSVETAELFERKYENCLKVCYAYAATGDHGEEYYAPGVGLVKAVMSREGGLVTIEMTLEKHEK